MLIVNGSLDIILMGILLIISFIVTFSSWFYGSYKNKKIIWTSNFFKTNYSWIIKNLITIILTIWLIILITYLFWTTAVLNIEYYDIGRIIVGVSATIAIVFSLTSFLSNAYHKFNFWIAAILFLSLSVIDISQFIVDHYKLQQFLITETDILNQYENNRTASFNNIQKKRVLVIGIDGLPYYWLHNPINYPILFDQNVSIEQKTIFKYCYPFYSIGAYESKKGWTSLLTGSNNIHPRKPNIFENIYENSKLSILDQSSLVQWPWINEYILNDNNFVHLKNSNLGIGWNLYNGIIGNYNTTMDIIKDINSNHQFIFSQFVLGDDMSHLQYPLYSHYSINQNQDLNQKITMITKLITLRKHDFNEDWLIIITTDHGRSNITYNHGDDFLSHQSYFVANQNLTKFITKPINSQYDMKPIILQ